MTDAPDIPPALLWLRRDLRLADNPALHAALERGGPVIPVWILDPVAEATGSAHRWRLEGSLRALAADLEALGARLILRRGEALTVLRELVEATGAKAVLWNRLYDAEARERDAAVKSALKDDGLAVESFNGALLHEPWTVETGQGGPYKVYTPYWRAVHERVVHEPIGAPSRWPSPDRWPDSDALSDWAMAADMRSGAPVLAARVEIGERAAQQRLAAFLEEDLRAYAEERDRPDRESTSGLSQHLAVGEISPRQIWSATQPRRQGAVARPAEKFLQELVWREFAYHLMYHTPELTAANWRPEWNDFPWRKDCKDAEAWRRGRTGIEAVDAAMRELFVTGRMHNRFRMIAASYLTKHLLVDWRVGEAWFRDTLVDWDPASNALGWQWVAGSGPDAAPYFRVFNPETQAEKFDPDARYRDRYLAEGRKTPHEDALAFFEAAPRSWGLSPDDPYPKPIVGLKEGRQKALDAYQDWKSRRDAA
ncbi:deoxyribodipyrimidine photo-lyase [Albimonas sp. CAU 1670]|uniref:cryptochrome/photolyase family protein n=1 Tax=Albimonas sp. CAU 1670 TaxID=3032599 RepID=UPI0023DBE251|nr:deoxyribodipyrimidine photo-lyase [Albimonas sp. CAU 1670]MDF2231607.1 deoxyribodipyrimidine photo-lyase [Albimonas sp. CAU 1670]